MKQQARRNLEARRRHGQKATKPRARRRRRQELSHQLEVAQKAPPVELLMPRGGGFINFGPFALLLLTNYLREQLRLA